MLVGIYERMCDVYVAVVCSAAAVVLILCCTLTTQAGDGRGAFDKPRGVPPQCAGRHLCVCMCVYVFYVCVFVCIFMCASVQRKALTNLNQDELTDLCIRQLLPPSSLLLSHQRLLPPRLTQQGCLRPLLFLIPVTVLRQPILPYPFTHNDGRDNGSIHEGSGRGRIPALYASNSSGSSSGGRVRWTRAIREEALGSVGGVCVSVHTPGCKQRQDRAACLYAARPCTVSGGSGW